MNKVLSPIPTVLKLKRVNESCLVKHGLTFLSFIKATYLN